MHSDVFTIFQVLRTPHMRLRALTPADLDAVQPIRFYDGLYAATGEEAERTLARLEQDYHNGQTIHWAIVLADTDTLVGTYGFYRGFADAHVKSVVCCALTTAAVSL